jgi:hypothetical protein
MNERKILALIPVFSLLICFKVAFGQTDGAPRFRVERRPVAGGAELITIWGRVVGTEPVRETQSEELPLVTVLRDTLGDEIKENDILRQVWVHTYAQPTLVQNAAALVPFLYKGVRVKPRTSEKNPPRAIIDLSDTSRPVWRQLRCAFLPETC